MVRISMMANTLKNICNAKKAGKRQVILRTTTSKVLVKFVKIMHQYGFIKEFKIIDDARFGKIEASFELSLLPYA